MTLANLPVNDTDFPFPDHWGLNWQSASDGWGLTMSVTFEAGLLLYALVRNVKPLNCVETGTHKGLSALFIASALRDNGYGHLVTLDIEEFGQTQRLAARGLTSEWVGCVIGQSVDYIPPDPIDFLFLDGDHSFESVCAELRHFSPYLSPGSLVALDDSRIVPAVRQAVDQEVISLWERLHIPNSRGLLVIRPTAGYFEAGNDGPMRERKSFIGA